jgi:hypothetical protein
MTRRSLSVWAGLFLVCLLFAWGAEAQQGGGASPNAPTPKLVNVNDIKGSSGVTVSGASDGSGGVTGPTVTLGIGTGGITDTMLAGSISPSKIAGTAATLGANSSKR